MTRRPGFILIIVLGLLAVLAAVAISFHSISGQSRDLSTHVMLQTQAQILARSGYESALASIYNPSNGLNSGRRFEEVIGAGTLKTNGDRATVSYDAVTGRININDGIAAGKLELGPAYEANELDPVGPDELIPSTFMQPVATNVGAMDPKWLLHFGMVMDPKVVRVGDVIVPRQIFGTDDFRAAITYFPKISVGAEPVILNEDIEMSAGFWWDYIDHYRPTRNVSGEINLRIRRLLNSYGDIHRFLDQLGHPADPDHLPSTRFSFTDSATLDRTRAIKDKGLLEGLGDRIIGSRPTGGYGALQEVEALLNTWGEKHLSPAYLANQPFFELVRDDLAAGSWTDTSVVRIKRELAPYYNDVVAAAVNTTDRNRIISLQSHDQNPPDLADLWAPHAASPVNLTAASPEVRAAVFGSIVNVSYLVQSTHSYPVGQAHLLSGRPGSSPRHVSPQSRYGVGSPVFRNDRITENGIQDLTQKNRFLSLQDSLLLSRAMEHYLGQGFSLTSHMEFRNFLGWYHAAFPSFRPFERALNGVVYDPDPLTGGHFTQDYVMKTLPHVLSGIRRMPHFLGAPQALLSPYLATDGSLPNGNGAWLYQDGQFAPGVRRRVEDFVKRHHLPLVSFKPEGRYTITSSGRVDDAGGNTAARSTIRTTIEAFSTSILRTQEQYVHHTDSIRTDSRIQIGPSLLDSGQDPDPNLGFVGLKTRSSPVPGHPQISMNFDGILDSNPGTNPPQDGTLDPFPPMLLAGRDAGLSNANLEDATSPMFGSGSEGCDLSPFGGVLFSSNNHGPQAGEGTTAFTDELYWRLQDPLPQPNPIINNGTAPGKALGTGHVSVWVRIPTTYEYPHEVQWYLDSSKYDCDRYVHVIWDLHFWQKDTVGGTPCSLTLFYALDPATNRGSFTLRYQVRERQWQYTNDARYLFPSWPITNFVNDPSLPSQDDVAHILIPPATAYADWMSTSRKAMEVEVHLKDLPEAGPGTWHHIQAGWNLTRSTGAPNWTFPFDTRMWVRVGDDSVVDNTTVGQEESPSRMMLKNHKFMAFTVGDAPVMRLDQFLNNSHFYFFQNDGTNTHLAPAWRFNSLIDDLRVQFGSLPSGHAHANDSGYDTVVPRYNIAGDPVWSVDFRLTSDARLVHFGTRVFQPVDSNQNHPTLKMRLRKSGLSSTAPAFESQDGFDQYFLSESIDSAARMAIAYTSDRPDGTPVVQSGTDHWNEIPWIQEVSWRIREPDMPKVLNWSTE